MANPVKGEVDFVVGQMTYTMKLGHNARAAVEGLLDRQFADIVLEVFDQKRVRNETIRALLFSALTQFHPDLTLFDVGDMMDEVGNVYVGERIGEALKLAAPKAPANPPRKTKQRKAGTTS